MNVTLPQSATGELFAEEKTASGGQVFLLRFDMPSAQFKSFLQWNTELPQRLEPDLKAAKKMRELGRNVKWWDIDEASFKEHGEIVGTEGPLYGPKPDPLSYNWEIHILVTEPAKDVSRVYVLKLREPIRDAASTQSQPAPK